MYFDRTKYSNCKICKSMMNVKKSYNPLIQLMHCCNNDQEKFDKSCRLMMTSMLSEAAKIFERLPILLHADIIRNVLYSGVWSKYEYIQMKKRKKHK